jgi:hypothetical protein
MIRYKAILLLTEKQEYSIIQFVPNLFISRFKVHKNCDIHHANKPDPGQAPGERSRQLTNTDGNPGRGQQHHFILSLALYFFVAAPLFTSLTSSNKEEVDSNHERA